MQLNWILRFPSVCGRNNLCLRYKSIVVLSTYASADDTYFNVCTSVDKIEMFASDLKITSNVILLCLFDSNSLFVSLCKDIRKYLKRQTDKTTSFIAD